MTYFIVTFTDGQQLKLIPVTAHGHRYIAWIAPLSMTVASVVAHLGGPYSDSGQTATAVPFDLPGQVPVVRPVAEAGPVRAAARRRGHRRGHGGRARLVGHRVRGAVGHLLRSVNRRRHRLHAIPARRSADGGRRAAGAAVPDRPSARPRPGVALVRVTLSDGRTVTVRPVAVGNERLFAFAIGKGVSPTGWTAYDASGREIGAGSMTPGSATSSASP